MLIPSPSLTLLLRATNPADRLVAVLSGLAIILLGSTQLISPPPGGIARIYRNNQPLMTLPLNQNRQLQIDGKLGAVTIEVAANQIRLLEYASPRMIGTRSGWIGNTGEITTCVPCGILIEIKGNTKKTEMNQPQKKYDGIAR